ncbi:MAG: PIN domain-containing protein, partial [Bacteroidota bacterium]
MIHSIRFTALLDTNAIYPLEIRDILFWFAYDELYTMKWSQHIFAEWEEVMQRKGVSTQEINKRIGWANKAFPDAMVENYEPLITGLTLPDEKDRHVLAAAIKVNADVIVTQNLKDFPASYLATFELVARHPDVFLAET